MKGGRSKSHHNNVYKTVLHDDMIKDKIISHFHGKITKWINDDKKLHNYTSDFTGMKGYNSTKLLIKLYKHKYNTQWYDLPSESSNIKKYILKKLYSIKKQ